MPCAVKVTVSLVEVHPPSASKIITLPGTIAVSRTSPAVQLGLFRHTHVPDAAADQRHGQGWPRSGEHECNCKNREREPRAKGGAPQI